ncbi:MAG: TrmH family RNA methyltransferase [Saprospiraceae bacterium]
MVMEKALNFREIRSNLTAYLAFIEKNRHPMVFILDHLSDKKNVASLFRLADAARIEHVYFFGQPHSETDSKLKRIARSASEFVPSSTINQLEELEQLKEKYRFLALEITNQSIPYYQYQGDQPVALLIGNEQNGLSQDLLKLSDQSIHIPMMGRNTSMNVAMATGIATYGLLDKMKRLP